MYCWIILSIILFSFLYTKEEWRWCFSFKNLHACWGYQVQPPLSFVETEFIPYYSKTLDRICSTTNTFRSLNIWKERISFILVQSPPQSQTIWACFYRRFINNIFKDFLFILASLFWFILLYPFPDRNVTSLYQK